MLLIAVTGCSGAVTNAVAPGKLASLPALPPPVHDPATLARQLASIQPGWPAPRFPVAPQPRGIDCRKLKCVALTFDDGPGDETGVVLDRLAEHGAKATFYVVGRMVSEKTAGLLQRMVTEGHELGNHSWDHPALPSLSEAGLKEQLVRTQLAVGRYTGVRMRTMRPPYGATSPGVAAMTRRYGMAQILWGLDTMDWRDRNADLVAKRCLKAKPGDVILMHDIHASTVQAVPKLLDLLDAKGFTYVTVTELFGETTPGKEYFHMRKERPT
ncbi:polysaccharide deacetylase family protein [Acrocarpospora macrocephala]|uniref:polysaccharide deacetylase family protein n=1 Tax=Acrocarpospora macrocephala TaxID=150177 RepID=UPI0035A21F71